MTVPDDRPLASVKRRVPSDQDRAIAAHVAALVPDGATMQFGVGGTPDAVLDALGDKHDLGVHSGLISDGLVDLVEAGVVTNARKPIDTGFTVAGAVVGTERLYRWAHLNPNLLMRPVTSAYRAAACDCWVLDEPGRLVALKMLVAPVVMGSPEAIPKEIDGNVERPLICCQRLI